MKKDPRPRLARHESERYETTEWRFSLALIKHKMNATAAAREVFTFGKKGGKSPHTAETVGSEYRRKPEVQQYVAELAVLHFNPLKAVQHIQEIAEDRKHPSAALQANIIILKMTGVFSDKGPPQAIPQVFLVSPVHPKEYKNQSS